MTIPRLLQMATYWGDHPPIHEMLAAFFGITEKAVAADAAVSAEDSGAQFLRDFIAAGGVIAADLGDVSG